VSRLPKAARVLDRRPGAEGQRFDLFP